MRACECFHLYISVPFVSVEVCVPVWFLVSLFHLPIIIFFFVLPADLQSKVNLLNLMGRLLQTRHHALVELNLLVNKVLQGLLQMGVALALKMR